MGVREHEKLERLILKPTKIKKIHTLFFGGCLLSKFQTIMFLAMLITWEDKLHDKMTSAYSKSCGYKKFSVHTNTKKYRFQIVPLWRAFSKKFRFRGSFYAY